MIKGFRLLLTSVLLMQALSKNDIALVAIN